MEDAQLHHLDLHLLSVDFKSAFNSVDQHCLHHIMHQLGVPRDAVEVVAGIYAGTTTKITCPAGTTRSVPVRRGTIQGDVLSPLLFLLALEPLLRWLDMGGRGYRCGSPPDNNPLTVPAGAYADDLNILAGDLHDMKLQVEKIERYGSWMSLGLAPQKCALTGILHHTAKRHGTHADDWSLLEPLLRNITINGHPVKLYKPNESFKYLGVHINMAQTWDDHVDKLILKVKSQGQQLAKCRLHYNIKRQIEETKILSGIKYHLSIMQPNKGLTDKLLKARHAGLMAISGLPHCTESRFGYLPKHKGGLGFQSIEPIFAQTSMEALVEDLNDEGHIGKLARALTIAQTKRNSANLDSKKRRRGSNQTLHTPISQTSDTAPSDKTKPSTPNGLLTTSDMWLNGHRHPSLSMMQAARGHHCDLILDWMPQLHVPLMLTHDIRNICNAVNTEWKRGWTTMEIDELICKPLWARRIFCPDGLVEHIAGTAYVVSLKDFPIKTSPAASRSLCLLTTLLCAPMGRVPTDWKGAPHDMLAEERRLPPSICTSRTGRTGATNHMLTTADLDPAVTPDPALIPRLRDMAQISRHTKPRGIQLEADGTPGERTMRVQWRNCHRMQAADIRRIWDYGLHLKRIIHDDSGRTAPSQDIASTKSACNQATRGLKWATVEWHMSVGLPEKLMAEVWPEHIRISHALTAPTSINLPLNPVHYGEATMELTRDTPDSATMQTIHYRTLN